MMNSIQNNDQRTVNTKLDKLVDDLRGKFDDNSWFIFNDIMEGGCCCDCDDDWLNQGSFECSTPNLICFVSKENPGEANKTKLCSPTKLVFKKGKAELNQYTALKNAKNHGEGPNI